MTLIGINEVQRIKYKKTIFNLYVAAYLHRYYYLDSSASKKDFNLGLFEIGIESGKV